MKWFKELIIGVAVLYSAIYIGFVLLGSIMQNGIYGYIFFPCILISIKGLFGDKIDKMRDD